MSAIKSLMKDTAIYGISSILGRFLNWCLVPLYTYIFAPEAYGVVNYVYSIIALAMIILTYGMETGFFRFASHERWKDPMQVYSTCLISLAVSSTAFIALIFIFIGPITVWMECGNHYSYVGMMAVCTAIDAYSSLPFAYLRHRHRPIRFAILKSLNIGINIAFNLFFLLLCPWLMKVSPGLVDWFYDPDFGIGYIFLSNLIASVVTLITLTPEMRGFSWTFCSRLWREILRYSAPLLVLGIAGMMNQTIDKILYPRLITDHAEALDGLGIYGANYKIAIVMLMFIQAFRFAYEPFIFSQNKKRSPGGTKVYGDAMKYFIIFDFVIFMGVMFYLDIIKYFISPRYFSGLTIVPVIMVAEIFNGIFYNLAVWYKLNDKTIWGAWFTLIGLAVTIVLNVVLVPVMGYKGCALAAVCCYGVMMLLSYFVGQAKHPIAYPLASIGMYTLVAAVLYGAGMYLLVTPSVVANYAIRACLITIYLLFIIRNEKLSLPGLRWITKSSK